jgi:hypothetical protein
MQAGKAAVSKTWPIFSCWRVGAIWRRKACVEHYKPLLPRAVLTHCHRASPLRLLPGSVLSSGWLGKSDWNILHLKMPLRISMAFLTLSLADKPRGDGIPFNGDGNESFYHILREILSMTIFDLHSDILTDYRDFVSSFIHIADERIRAYVERALDEEAHLWPDFLLQLSPSYQRGAAWMTSPRR